MNMNEINEAIRQLEDGPTTYHNCMKLASLYIVRDMYGKEGSRSYNYNMYANNASNNGRRAGGSSRYDDRNQYGYDPLYYGDDMHMGRSSMF